MRKLSAMFLALFVGGLLFATAPAFAEPSGKCAGGQVPGAVKTGTDGANSISVCSPSGAVTAAYKGGTGYYIAADGDSTNPDPSDGYIAVSDKGVACSSAGDYSYSAAHRCP